MIIFSLNCTLKNKYKTKIKVSVHQSVIISLPILVDILKASLFQIWFIYIKNQIRIKVASLSQSIEIKFSLILLIKIARKVLKINYFKLKIIIINKIYYLEKWKWESLILFNLIYNKQKIIINSKINKVKSLI